MSRFLLDTNIVLGLVRDAPFIHGAHAATDFLSSDASSFLSIVSLGELWSLAYQFGWGEGKRKHLAGSLDRFSVLRLSDSIVERYAEIDAYSQGSLPGRSLPAGMTARNVGKNDLWIAATASVTGATLITTDRDFDHLDGTFLHLVRIDPTTE